MASSSLAHDHDSKRVEMMQCGEAKPVSNGVSQIARVIAIVNTAMRVGNPNRTPVADMWCTRATACPAIWEHRCLTGGKSREKPCRARTRPRSQHHEIVVRARVLRQQTRQRK